MVQVAEIDFHVSGDYGGVGVSRFRFTRQDSTGITVSDCNLAAAAAKAIFAAAVSYIPSVVGWTCQPQVNIYEVSTGLVDAPLFLTTIPATAQGSASGTWAAGSGCRINWKTSTVHGRRLMRGALYLVPLAAAGFGSTGAVLSTARTAIDAACATYLTAMAGGQLYPVVWSRPAKGTFSGGTTGIITAGISSPTPSSLRSRRS